MERYWHVGGRSPWRGLEVFPRAPGPFIRRAADSNELPRELVIGQWGLVPWFANTWTDKASGEIVESYTMLTLNADAHPLMSRMHKPDPKLAADKQDKRSVVSIETDDVDQWLNGTLAEGKQLVRLPAVEAFDAGPARALASPPRPLDGSNPEISSIGGRQPRA